MTHLFYREDVDAMLMTVQGRVVLDDYRKALNELVHSEYFHSNMSTIWDLRKADLCDLTTGDIRDGALLSVLSAEERGTNWKTAIVVEGDLGFGLARMFEVFANGAPYRMTIFQTIEKAEAWIKKRSD